MIKTFAPRRDTACRRPSVYRGRVYVSAVIHRENLSQSPKVKTEGNTSDFSEGPRNAEVMLVGQNPGKNEVLQRRPFMGRSGKFLDKVLEECGLKRKELYLTSLVKEPTPKNTKPTARQIEHWMPYLLSEISQINPRIIVLMGQVAWKTPRLPGIQYIETYHPAAAMRFPQIRRKFRADFRRLAQELAPLRRPPARP